MKTPDKIEAYYSREQRFRKEIGLLRDLALQTDAKETIKWNAPVYTIKDKNVFGIMAFKSHFSVWFFNGALLKDVYGKLEAGQEGTKALRHWKFTCLDEIEPENVLAYMTEAIENQKKGIVVKKERLKKPNIPALLQEKLDGDTKLKASFNMLSPYKQREYCEYITSAKQDKTRLARLKKCIPLLKNGKGLNDRYG
jgi:uncharacterized protein YdeI (YjbR/CyaY-like superfamily)